MRDPAPLSRPQGLSGTSPERSEESLPRILLACALSSAACFEGLQEIAAGLGFVPTYHRNWVGFGQPGAGKPFPILVYPRRIRLHVGIRAVRAEPEFPSELEYEGARRPAGRQRFYLNSLDELSALQEFLPKAMV